MGKFTLSTCLMVAVLVSPLSAMAADAESSSGGDFSGLYGGIEVGHMSSDFYERNITVNDHLFPFDSEGVLGKIHLGYDHQMSDDLVIGVEASLKFGDITGVVDPSFVNGGINTDWTGNGQIDHAIDIRARVGKKFGNVMPYVTGGFTLASVSYAFLYKDVIEYQNTTAVTGWTVGAGLQWSINERLSLRGQYIYADYGSFVEDPDGPAGYLAVERVYLSAREITVGASWRF